MSVTWLLAVLPLLALAMTIVNAASWRRGRVGARFPGRVSVLIPARNEAARLPACLRALAASAHPIDEILVYDDDSTDGTAEVLGDLSRELPSLRIVRGGALPPGWVGKPHACQRLFEEARGDLLVYLDADVALEPFGLDRLASLFVDHQADVVTALPRQLTRSLVERLVVPFLLLSYVSWLPLELVLRTRDSRLLAANGQVLAMRASTLATLGGFRAVAHEIVDDVAFCRHAKVRGLRVAFIDGTRIAACRMYTSGRAVWEGFSKNIHEGVGGTPALAVVLGLYFTAFVAPYAALAAALVAWPALLGPALVGVAALALQQLLLAARWRQPVLGALTHPAGALAVITIALNSARWSLRGDILWAGRRYAKRQARKGAA